MLCRNQEKYSYSGEAYLLFLPLLRVRWTRCPKPCNATRDPLTTLGDCCGRSTRQHRMRRRRRSRSWWQWCIGVVDDGSIPKMWETVGRSVFIVDNTFNRTHRSSTERRIGTHAVINAEIVKDHTRRCQRHSSVRPSTHWPPENTKFVHKHAKSTLNVHAHLRLVVVVSVFKLR